MAEPMDYASAGVDIDLEGAAVASLIASLSASSRPAGTPGAPVDLPGWFWWINRIRRFFARSGDRWGWK